MCAHAAAGKGAKSIAIPAMGTGNLGWPPECVARLMIDAIEQFDQAQGSKGSLKDVRFVVYSKDTKSCQVLDLHVLTQRFYSHKFL